MHIHYFLYWAKDATNSQLALELRKAGADFQIFSDCIRTNYKWRSKLYFIIWPRLFIFSFHQGIKSLFSKPKPDVVIVSSHIELVILGFLKKLLGRHRVKLILSMFIYTSDDGATWKQKIKYRYFRLVLRLASRIICHSKREVVKYNNLFEFQPNRFVYIPYALYVDDPNINNFVPSVEPYILSAGRSGRDYDLLTHVFKDLLPYCLHIVCDSADALVNTLSSANIKILRNCYGDSYLQEIKNSSLVVISLKANDISAGQMVMLQAMFYAKPIIITRTATTIDYVKHNETAWFIEQGDPQSLKMAIQHLISDPAESKRLGENGRKLYESQHSISTYVKNILKIIKELPDE